MTVADISLALSVFALLISTASVYYTRRQAADAKREEVDRMNEDAELARWMSQYDAAVRQVLIIAENFFSNQDASNMSYPAIFPDSDLQRRIEMYLIDADWVRPRFQTRQVTIDLLRTPIVQQTIRNVLDCTKRFKENHPHSAQELDL